MLNQKFKPLFDKKFCWIWIPTLLMLAAGTFLAAGAPIALCILIITDVFTLYFIISPLFAYAELRENSLFVKFGFFVTREIPYIKIRGISKEHKLYADSMISIKNSLDHVNVKYNTFDVISISVADNDSFIKALEARMKG